MDTREIVRQISKLNISGNIMPLQWCRSIRRESGSVHLAAVVILTEVVFWYRWRVKRSSTTGAVTGVQVRFAGKAFRRSLTAWQELFGLSRKEVRNALATLKRLGLVEVRVSRATGSGRRGESAIVPNPEAIWALTDPEHCARPGSTCARGGTTYGRRGTIPKSSVQSPEKSNGKASELRNPERRAAKGPRLLRDILKGARRG